MMAMPGTAYIAPGGVEHSEVCEGAEMSTRMRDAPGNIISMRPLGFDTSLTLASSCDVHVALKIPQNEASDESQSTYSPSNAIGVVLLPPPSSPLQPAAIVIATTRLEPTTDFMLRS